MALTKLEQQLLSDDEFKYITDLITQRKAHKSDIEALAKHKRASRLIVEVQDFIKEHNGSIYYLTTGKGSWFFKITDSNGSMKWASCAGDSAFKRKFPEMESFTANNQDAWDYFSNLAKSAGWWKSDITLSIKPDLPEHILNMLLLGDILQPKQGELHPAFKILMRSLSDNDAAAEQHIKQVIGWKYTHLGDYRIPALCFFGSGGSGKTVFSSTLLPTIFGTGNCTDGMFTDFIDFNGNIAGKLVVSISEKPASRTDENKLKSLVGSPFITINEKFAPRYQAENMAMFVLSTNDLNGPVKIDRDGAERRWSLMKTSYNVYQITQKYLTEVTGNPVSLKEATDYWDLEVKDKNVFTDKEQVAIFLNECIEEANKLQTTPKAYHEEAFHQLVLQHEDAFASTLRDIITAHKFDVMSGRALYEIYKIVMRRDNENGRIVSFKQFKSKIKHLLRDEIENGSIVMPEKMKYDIITCKNVNFSKDLATNGRSWYFYDPRKIEDLPSTNIKISLDPFIDGTFYLEQDKPQRAINIS